MTFQEAWDAERRANCTGCKNGLVRFDGAGCWYHDWGQSGVVGGPPHTFNCTAPTSEQFEEQVWSRLEAAKNRISELEAERDRLRTALKALSDVYDYQTEDRACICGSNDAGEHNAACLRHQQVCEQVSKALADTQGQGEKEPTA